MNSVKMINFFFGSTKNKLVCLFLTLIFFLLFAGKPSKSVERRGKLQPYPKKLGLVKNACEGQTRYLISEGVHEMDKIQLNNFMT